MTSGPFQLSFSLGSSL